VGAVNALSVLNVGSKLLWGAGIVVAFALGGGVEHVAWALTLSEGGKTVALALITRRHLGFRTTVNLRGTSVVLAASLPFFLTEIARTVFAKVDISVMSFLASDMEVGWYAAASNLAGLTMLITPLIGWVLLPLTSRAAARSNEELTVLTRRAMELILVTAIPVTLLMCLGADVIVDMVFGAAFAPATRSLRILAPMFVLTYVAIVSACTLVRLDRGWAVTWVLMSGLAVSPLLNWLLIPRCLTAFGPGGAGIGAAIALLTLETCMTAVMTWMVARRAFDRRSVTVLAKTGVVCVVVVVLDRLLLPFGALRMAADGLLYAGLVVAWKAVDVQQITQFVRHALARRGESYAGAV
jgi:O-antigen/teichoic acid export membrane protein